MDKTYSSLRINLGGALSYGCMVCLPCRKCFRDVTSLFARTTQLWLAGRRTKSLHIPTLLMQL